MTNPLITTVIPTFRRPILLKRAINSVLAQSFKNLKICVYDNASEDETEEVVAEYIRHDNRVSYVKNRKNIGSCNNMTKGVDSVQTDYFSLLNDDDFLLPDFYSNSIQVFERNPKAEFVCAKTISVNVINKKWNFRNKNWSPGFYQPSNMITSKMYSSHFTLTGILWRTISRKSLTKFVKSGDDRLLLTSAAALFPFVVLKDYGAVFTIHQQAFSRTTGLRGQNNTILTEVLLSEVKNIMQSTLTSENKVHLLMLVLKSYNEIIDYKKFKHIMLGDFGKDKSELMLTPSHVTSVGIFAEIYKKAPVKTHTLMKHCFNLIIYIKSLLDRKKFKTEWLDIPDDTYSLIFDEYKIKTFEEMLTVEFQRKVDSFKV